VIQPEEVIRDEDGMWTHSAMPHSDYEFIPLAWFTDQGLEVATVEFENDADEQLTDTWFETGHTDCSGWEPSKPPGEGWFVFSIHDGEDGPVCVWLRQAPPVGIDSEGGSHD